MRSFLRQLIPATVVLGLFTLLLGVAYPLVVTAIGQTAFRDNANGSLVRVGGRVVGSSLIGQPFAAPEYFHPRPSAAGHDGGASSGSNLGPWSADLLSEVQSRAEAYRVENGLGADAEVPVDAVTASASGLDPHISVANARLQAARVAAARSLPIEQVLQMVDRATDDRDLVVLGVPGVNVLRLNVMLDATAAD